MNLSKKARAVAIPSLEIDQPDCRRAAHSCSVGPIDETQLFYLESRGIPPDEARKFIVLGFLEPVVARVPLAAAQDRLRELLEDEVGRRRTAAPETAPRDVRRIDLIGVDEVPDGHDEDGLGGRHGSGAGGQLGRRDSRDAGRLQPRVLRARQGVPDERHAHVRPAPVALRPRQRRAARSAGGGAAGRLPGRPSRTAASSSNTPADAARTGACAGAETWPGRGGAGRDARRRLPPRHGSVRPVAPASASRSFARNEIRSTATFGPTSNGSTAPDRRIAPCRGTIHPRSVEELAARPSLAGKRSLPRTVSPPNWRPAVRRPGSFLAEKSRPRAVPSRPPRRPSPRNRSLPRNLAPRAVPDVRRSD